MSDQSKVDPASLTSQAPVPDKSATGHETDSQGVRKIDAESERPRLSLTDPAKAKPRTAPKGRSMAPVLVTTVVNNLRALAAAIPPTITDNLQPSFFIPSFALAYEIINGMNHSINGMRPYGQRGSDNLWLPHFIVMYYSVLFYVQTLRAQDLVIGMTSDQRTWYDQFLSDFPLESLPIHGPLVHVFRCLSACNPGLVNFADVCPAIPSMHQRERYAFENAFPRPAAGGIFYGLHKLLPSISHQYYIMYLVLAHTMNAGTYSTFNHTAESYTNGVTRENGQGDADFADFQAACRRLKTAVGTYFRPPVSDQQASRVSNSLTSVAHHFPSPWVINVAHFPNAAGSGTGPTAIPARPTFTNEIRVTNFSQQMMMDESTLWFQIIVRAAKSISKYFKGNSNLNAISAVGSAAPLVEFQHATIRDFQSRPFGVQNTSNMNSSTSKVELFVTGKHACPFIQPEDREDAQTALINVEHSGATANVHTFNGLPGALNVTKFGPFWSVSPTVETFGRHNLTEAIVTMTQSEAYFDPSGKQ